MLVECLIKREGPTVVTMEGFSYEFKDREGDGRMVCEMHNGGHIDRLLSTKTLYRPYIPENYAGVAVADDAPTIPDFSAMSLLEIRQWGNEHFGQKVRGANKEHALRNVMDELRRRGWSE